MEARCGRWPSVLGAVLWLGAAACGLGERGDFLLGRPCTTDRDDCGAGGVCLPHERAPAGDYRAFFCRTPESFDPAIPDDLPRAFCDPDRGLDCPSGAACVPDRIRIDAGPRALVCAPE